MHPGNGKRAAEPGFAGTKILVVEDHTDTARVMQKLLSAAGHQVSTAASLSAALTWLEAGEPLDLVISDLGLPDGSGLDLMRMLKARKPIQGIALTGYGRGEDVADTREAGFERHLTKPVTPEALVLALVSVRQNPASR